MWQQRPTKRRTRIGLRPEWIWSLTVLLVLWGCAFAFAQTPRMLEINTLCGESDGSSPEGFCTIGDLSYFTADDGTYGGHGRELWVTDGTAEGTHMVADIRNGSDSSNPQNLTAIDGTLYFSADDGGNGRELWVYDGSSLTQLDVNSSSASNPAYFVAFNGAIYFAAEGDTGGGRELWKLDGTNVSMAADVNPTGGSDPTELLVMDGSLYFAAENGTDGRQVMRHEADGSTILVKNVSGMVGYSTDPVMLSASPEELTVLGNELYYTAEYFNGSVGSSPPDLLRRELFVTDGTDAGTIRISDIGITESLQGLDVFWMMDARDANVRELTVMDGTVYFIAHEPSWIETSFMGPMHGGWTEVWKTDGTLAGTQRITSIGYSTTLSVPPNDAGSDVDPQELTAMDSRLYFSAESYNNNRELWCTDGISTGSLVLEIRTGNRGSNPQHFCAADTVEGKRLFFQAYEYEDGMGCELWITDGTATGTAMVKDLVSDANSSEPEDIVAFKSGVLFSAETQDNKYGRELHISNGTEAGTYMLSDVAPGPTHSDGAYLTAVGDTLYLSANDGAHGREVWRSQGTAETTQLVSDVMPGSSLSSYPTIEPYDLTALGNTLYFFQRDGGRRPNLYKTDGTTAGTERVHDFFPTGSPDDPQTPIYIDDPSGLTAFNGALYFCAYDYNLAGLELWTSDGTDSGTYMLKDIFDKFYHTVYGDYASEPQNFTVVGNTLFFTATAEGTGLDLWKTDGTETGTVLVKNADVDKSTMWGATPFGDFVAVNDRLFYMVNTYSCGMELWISDGTDAGTTITRDIAPGTADASPDDLVALGDRVLFQANDGTSGAELWISDGTESGTVLLKDIATGSVGSAPQGMLAHNGLVYFSADDGINGAELWVTDGTETGTVLLKDIQPGADGSSPECLLSLPQSDHFIFIATTADAGRELWISDGTTSGTTLLVDFVTGSGDGNLDEPTLCGTKLYFLADDGTMAGNELWVMDIQNYMRFHLGFKTDGTVGARLDGPTFQKVRYGQDSQPVWAIAPSQYSFAGWLRNGQVFGASNPLMLENVTADTTFTAIFSGPIPASAKHWERYK